MKKNMKWQHATVHNTKQYYCHPVVSGAQPEAKNGESRNLHPIRVALNWITRSAKHVADLLSLPEKYSSVYEVYDLFRDYEQKITQYH